jgi:hypothetical protein
MELSFRAGKAYARSQASVLHRGSSSPQLAVVLLPFPRFAP